MQLQYIWILFSESITVGRRQTKKLYGAKPGCHNLENSNFSKILTLARGLVTNIDLISSLARISLPPRRHGSQFKCLVEWLHRREIAPAGSVGHANLLELFGYCRCSNSMLAMYKSTFRKRVAITKLQGIRISCSESMKVGRCQTKKPYQHSHCGPWRRNRENSKFSKIKLLVQGLTIKIAENYSLARISLFCVAAVHNSSVS